ncbi:hypothetical protein LPMP_251090 [Leishmania panamensis]|uniref:Uncharacterized protein n=3 Tax=Leishmania panamensis TaxID=5679 RepID=A0AC62A5L1_LEIPA
MLQSTVSSIAFEDQRLTRPTHNAVVSNTFTSISMNDELTEGQSVQMSLREELTEGQSIQMSLQEEPVEGPMISMSLREEPTEGQSIQMSLREEPTEGQSVQVSLQEEPVEGPMISMSLREEPTEGQSIQMSLREELTEGQSIQMSLQDELTEGQSIQMSLQDELTEGQSIQMSLQDELTEGQSIQMSLREEPTEGQSIQMSLREELTEGQSIQMSLQDELTEGQSVQLSLRTTTVQSNDDIVMQMSYDIGSASEQSLSYQLQDSRMNEDQLSLEEVKPPQQLSQRAAKAALTPRSQAAAPVTPGSRSGTTVYIASGRQRVSGEQEMSSIGSNLLTVGTESSRGETNDVVVTEHTRHFPGSKWEATVAALLETVKRAVANETAAAIGVKLKYVQVMKVEATAAGMTCGITIGHPSSMATSEVDEKLSSCPYEGTMALLEYLIDHGKNLQSGLSADLAASEAAASARDQPIGEQEEVPAAAPKKKAKEDAMARARRKIFRPLPKLLVTPRTYQFRAPRPGAEHSMDRDSILYGEGPKEGAVGFRNGSLAPDATPRGGTNGSRSPSTWIHRNGITRHSVHVSPQHVQRGVVPAALRPRPIIQTPLSGASTHRSINGVECMADTHEVSHRSRSSLQMTLTLGVDSKSDAAPGESLVTPMSMVLSGSTVDQDDHTSVTLSVKGATDVEEAPQSEHHEQQEATFDYDVAYSELTSMNMVVDEDSNLLVLTSEGSVL